MQITATARRPWLFDSKGSRPRLATRAHLITALVSCWAMARVLIDGWAHTNISGTLESFFNPWHALLYSGFTAAAVWLVYIAAREQTHFGNFDLSRIPLGYGLALVGALLFGASGVGDMVWHSIFGIEEGTEALMSPTHFGLFIGLTLMLSAPLRAAWHDSEPEDLSFGKFFPILLSATLSLTSIGFFLMYLSPFSETWAAGDWTRWVRASSPDVLEQMAELGIAGVVVTSLLFLAPVMIGLKRWDLPFGSATFLTTFVAVSLNLVQGLEKGELVVAAIVGGLAADSVIYARRSGRREHGARWVAAAAPVVTWSTYFGVMQMLWGVGWAAEYWSGAVVLSSLVCLGVSYLVFPPDIPTDRRTA